jgi:hypothetical protein
LSPVFFTDRDLGKNFPKSLAAAGLKVERHCDLFPENGPDEQWLEYVGKKNRIALTHDRRIRYRPNELVAVVNHKVRLLVFVGSSPLPALATNFIATLPKIENFIAKHEPPYIAKIYRASPADLARNPNASGAITLWYPK